MKLKRKKTIIIVGIQKLCRIHTGVFGIFTVTRTHQYPSNKSQWLSNRSNFCSFPIAHNIFYLEQLAAEDSLTLMGRDLASSKILKLFNLYAFLVLFKKSENQMITQHSIWEAVPQISCFQRLYTLSNITPLTSTMHCFAINYHTPCASLH